MPPTYTTTIKHALRWLTGTNIISDIDAGFQAIAEDVDSKLTPYDTGTLALRPVSTAGTPGKTGRWYRATDTGQLFLDFGTGWYDVGAVLSASGLTIGTDVNLYRSAANKLKTDDSLGVAGYVSVGEDDLVGSKLFFGSSSDTNLYRFAANTLKTDDGLSVKGFVSVGEDDLAASKLFFGSGSDTNLYRSAANALKTDDALEVVGALTKGGVAVVLADDTRLTNQRAPQGPETNLKIIRGTILFDASIVVGSGFTASKTGTGAYLITFTTAFASEPVVQPSAIGGVADANLNTRPTVTTADINRVNSAGTLTDGSLSFVAIGPA